MGMYFSFYPSAVYNSKYVTDILIRTKIKDSWLADPKLYYEYTYKDSDKPEHLAKKYYGKEDLHWIILFTNNIFDVNWEFPIPYQTFLEYIEDKYASVGSTKNKTGLEYAQTTPHPIYRYQKKVTIKNNEGINSDYYVIDEKSYYDLPERQFYSTGESFTKYVTTTFNSKEIFITDPQSISVGDIVSGNPSIPLNTTIESRINTNSFTISNPALVSSEAQKTFITSTFNTTTYEITRKTPAVTIFEHEYEENESKRKIKILNKTYVKQAVKELIQLVKQ